MRIKFMRQIIRKLKTIYYFIFTQLAYRCLRRRNGIPSNVSKNINLVCTFGLNNGLTNGANYNFLALEKLGYIVRKVDITPAIRNPFKKITCTNDGVFVFHCAAPSFLQLAWPLRQSIKGKKLIGYFAWELPCAPSDWPNYGDIWDEIWTTSHFSAVGLRKLYDCPIRVVPHVLLEQGTPHVWHKGSEPLTFLTMADARSSLMRKNPAGAIVAFRRAFPVETDVALIIKLQVNKKTPDEVDKLLKLASGDSRIFVITESLRREEVDALIAKAHVYISLHRAEGFGLPLLEARLAGLATIATGWSGNMDYMNEQDSALVPYRLATMIDEGGVYGEVTWADPDLDAAAVAIRRFYDDPAYLSAIAQAGWANSSPEKQLQHFKAWSNLI
jgi:glycosyltransferase involved in cell wall biosynthesis